MNKTYLMFKHEFLQTMKKPGFIILTLIVPVLALLAIGGYQLVTTLIEPSAKEVTIVGYVDEVGIFREQTDQGLITLIPFASREEATQALVRKDVSEYIVIPSDYTSSGTIQRYTLAKELIPPPVTIHLIESFLTWNLLKDDVPSDVITAIVTPLNLEVTRLNENGDIAKDQGSVGNIIVPAIFALMLSFALMLGASSLIGGLGEEKESRLIEVLFSSVSVRQLLIAKILALGTAGLLQVIVWLISAPLLLNLASSTFGGFLSDIQLPANFILLGVVYFVLGYLLFAILSVTVGGISSNASEAQTLAMFYIMMLFVPIWFAGLMINFPNNPIWVVLSIFPFTAPIQIMLRLGVSDVPAWQIVTSIGVLGLSIIVALVFSTKIFRTFMMMYGKKPSIAEIIQGLKTA
ncbi:MAG TPA: ABC transporter permease [Anaerolineales bacterium]|nr:ABC transporter permease [Anaerolineales bacterium]